MDIMYDGKKPELDMPYYGKQARFFEFFKRCITPYLPTNGIYAETNSGSVSNAFEFAKLGYRVIVNDIGEYSNAIANAVFVNSSAINPQDECKYEWLNEYKNSYIDRAAIIASNITNNGYNAPMPKSNSRELREKAETYREELSAIRQQGVFAYRIFNEDLYKYLQVLENLGITVDAMFMDFAWPWRNGNETDEYNTTANVLSGIFKKKEIHIDLWNQQNVIEKVLQALHKAKKVSKYIFVSNQSSNYPTPEMLEIALLKNGFPYEARHTMLTKATTEDNLLNEEYFREYLYVIKC